MIISSAIAFQQFYPKNSVQANTVEIVHKSFSKQYVKIISKQYSGTNIPALLSNSKILLNGDKLSGQTILAVAKYTLNTGKSYYNFQFGSRYYWIDTQACRPAIKITQMQACNQPIYFSNMNYGLYNTPANLNNSQLLISGQNIPHETLQAIAKYTLSDGTSYYNFKYGKRYFWSDTRAFKNEFTIVKKDFHNYQIRLKSTDFGFYNTPASFHDAKMLIAGSGLDSLKLESVATYAINDGTSYYNFKYNNRYYWADTRAFVIEQTIIKRQLTSQKMRIISNQYSGFNTPASLPDAQSLISGNQQLNNVVKVIAKYQTSDGNWFYNYQLGSRYYWTDARAFKPEYNIIKQEKISGNVKIKLTKYHAFNTPAPLHQAKQLLISNQLQNKKVHIVARYLVSNNAWYFNFKFGNRYYWMDSRGFELYQNPSQYIQISDTQIKPAGATPYNIYSGYEGVKVWLTQRKLGVTADGRYGSSTINAVKSFQRNHKLIADGVLNLATWNKMGYSSGCWKLIDSYVSPLKVHLWNSRSEHIEAMIRTAYQYLDRPYINGASSTPDYGVDCSGLTMQSLYAAGINPLPSSSYIHSHPGHEWESRTLWANSKLKTIAYNQRQRGDLIFYYSPYDDRIWHVAIYLGNNQVIESWPPRVMVQPIKNGQRSWIAGVKRPFI